MNDRVGSQLTDQKRCGVDDLRIDRLPYERRTRETPRGTHTLWDRRKDGFGGYGFGHGASGLSVLNGLQT
jgi:hypothetical protein